MKKDYPTADYKLLEEMILTIPVIPDFSDISLYVDIEEIDSSLRYNEDKSLYRKDFKRYISQCGLQKVIPFSQIQIGWNEDHFLYKKDDSYFLDKFYIPKENCQQVIDLLIKSGKAHKINFEEIESKGFEQFKEELFPLLRSEGYKVNEMRLSFMGFFGDGKGKIFIRKGDDKNKMRVSVDADDRLNEKISNYIDGLYQKLNGQLELF